MRRLTDEQRAIAARVWAVAERHIEHTLTREEWLRRWRDELTSFAAVIVLRVATKWRPDGGAALESFALSHLRHLVSNWMAAGGRHWCRRWDELPDLYAGEWCCPVRAAERAEAPREVDRALSRLSGDERAVAVAVGRDEMKHEDAARVLDMKPQRVRRLWVRAVRKCGGETERMYAARGLRKGGA